jgi:hypothetical protein
VTEYSLKKIPAFWRNIAPKTKEFYKNKIQERSERKTMINFFTINIIGANFYFYFGCLMMAALFLPWLKASFSSKKKVKSEKVQKKLTMQSSQDNLANFGYIH